MMAKSEYALVVDRIQDEVGPVLTGAGFRGRGRTFNRTTSDQLTQVISFQMGAFDPPGTQYIPGIRESLYGLFTVNVGVFVPEVARFHLGIKVKGFVPVTGCCIRARLGELGPERRDLWFRITLEDGVAASVRERIGRDALPFLARFAMRDLILDEWRDVPDSVSHCSPPRIAVGIILAVRGQREEARRLLADQARRSSHPGHVAFVRELAGKLGVGELGGEV
ncbi:MAG: DUF4304 domain-containing protein, partial [Phycisphaerae bacterium]|nr:DUF4304 domain-containing protein [Phycisphaerae bacterium]